MNLEERSQKMWQEYPGEMTVREKKKFADLQKVLKKKGEKPHKVGFSRYEKRLMILVADEEKREANRAVRRKREAEVISMRLDKEMTLGEIGAAMGVTRERIRQIIAKFEKREGITLQVDRRHAPTVETKCHVCSVPLTIRNSQFRGEGRHTCKEHRYIRVSNMTYPEGLTANERYKYRLRWRYHNDPEFRARRTEQTKKWNKRQYEIGNRDFIDKQSAYSKAWHEKRMLDPEYRKMRAIYAHKQYLKYKDDPAYKEEGKIRQKRYMEKKKRLQAERMEILRIKLNELMK